MTFLHKNGTCSPTFMAAESGARSLAHAQVTHIFRYTSLAIILTGILVVIGTSLSCVVLFFGRPRYKKITVTTDI